ncbi:MAG: tetratricopeptide repeat protein [Leptospiraceae bacterium]|nr:tetratricopeptide repeat protein [Leptospiraceae bacterium]MCP5503455.1 tetratricopeptide repeat protein [Leptospiraceae bacterium]
MRFIFALFLMGTVSIFAADMQEELKKNVKLEYEQKYLEALNGMKQILDSNHLDYFYNLRYAWLSYLNGNLSQSIEYYQKAIVLSPDSIEARIGQLKPLLALGKYKQSEIIAKSVMRKDPKNYTARSIMAYGFYLSGQFAQAEEIYESLLLDYPSDTEMLLGLAWTYVKRGKKQLARNRFLEALKTSPGNLRALEGLQYTGK